MAIDEALFKVLEDIRERLEHSAVTMTEIKGDIKNINTTLNGNGKKGLCEEIEEMKAKDTCHDNFILEYKTEKKFIIAIAVFVSGLITTAIKLFWK